MTAADVEADQTTEIWVYAGERPGAGGGTVHTWYGETTGPPGRPPDDPHYFKKPLVKAAGVGGMYEVVVTRGGTGTTVHGTPKYKRMVDAHDWPGAEATVQGWHAEHRGARAALVIESQRRRDKDGAPQLFDMTLKEVREKMMVTNYTTVEGIMGAVVAYLGRGIR